MKKFFLIPLTAILLCSCGGLTNITTPNSVALNQGNFRFVKMFQLKSPHVMFLASVVYPHMQHLTLWKN